MSRDDVVSGAAIEVIVADLFLVEEAYVAAVATDDVVAVTPFDDVVAEGSIENVVLAVAPDVVVLRAADDILDVDQDVAVRVAAELRPSLQIDIHRVAPDVNDVTRARTGQDVRKEDLVVDKVQVG